MIRALASRSDKLLVLLGLEDENLRRMMDDEPIIVNLRNLDPDGPPVEALPDIDVCLFHATPEAIAELAAQARL